MGALNCLSCLEHMAFESSHHEQEPINKERLMVLQKGMFACRRLSYVHIILLTCYHPFTSFREQVLEDSISRPDEARATRPTKRRLLCFAMEDREHMDEV